MKAWGIAFFGALISFSVAHADNTEDFTKLNSSLDTSVEQPVQQKQTSTTEMTAFQKQDPNLAPVHKQPLREPSNVGPEF